MKSIVSGIVLLTLYLAAALNLAAAPAGLRLGPSAPVYAVADKSLDLTDEVTLEAWVRADKMSDTGGRILDKTKPGTQLGYMLDTWPGNSLRLLNAQGMCRFDAKLPADKWTHVVGVFSASKRIMKLYMNGKEVASLEGYFAPMTRSEEPLCVGADPKGANRFTGRILRAAVYRRALTAQDVAQRAAID